MLPIVCDLAISLVAKGAPVYIGLHSELKIIDLHPEVNLSAVIKDMALAGMWINAASQAETCTVWISFGILENTSLTPISRDGEKAWALTPA